VVISNNGLTGIVCMIGS